MWVTPSWPSKLALALQCSPYDSASGRRTPQNSQRSTVSELVLHGQYSKNLNPRVTKPAFAHAKSTCTGQPGTAQRAGAVAGSKGAQRRTAMTAQLPTGTCVLPSGEFLRSHCMWFGPVRGHRHTLPPCTRSYWGGFSLGKRCVQPMRVSQAAKLCGLTASGPLNNQGTSM